MVKLSGNSRVYFEIFLAPYKILSVREKRMSKRVVRAIAGIVSVIVVDCINFKMTGFNVEYE